MKNIYNKYITIFGLSVLGILGTSVSAQAQLFPLSENDWKNPEFVERYLGSYGVDMELSPEVTIAESTIIQDLTPFIEDDVENGIFFLEPKITPESSAAMDYMLAQLYLENQQPDEAISSYNNAIRKFPNFLRAYKNIALAYMQKNDCVGAMPHLNKVLEIGKPDGLTYGFLGYCYLDAKNYSASMSAYGMARLYEPEKKNWKTGHAQAALQANKYQDAIIILDQLVREEPGNASFLMLQANAYLSLDDDEGAISNLEILNRLGSASGMSHTLLGDLYVRNEIPLLALRSYTAALNADARPDFTRASRALDYFAREERWQNAQSYLNRLKGAYEGELEGKDQIALSVMEAQIAQGNEQYSQAASLLNDVVSRDPLNGKALLLLAQNHKAAGDFERAEFFYDRAAMIDDVAFEALTDNARMAVSFRRLVRALSLLERANKINPSSTIDNNIRILRNAINAGGT